MFNIYIKLGPDDIELFSFDGIECPTLCVGVYDGDTITVILRVHGKIIKLKIRLYGIDAPERRLSKNTDEEEKNRNREPSERNDLK